VSADGLVYECAAAPSNRFCGQAGYEPGTGGAWDSAWTILGSCTGSMAPTSSPDYSTLTNMGGCPEAYVAGTEYDAADTVSADGLVYECAAAPSNRFCGQAGYEPGTGGAWDSAWTILGSCTGSMAPTGSPDYSTLTNMGGCPSAWEGGANAYEAGDEVSSEGLVFECRAFPSSSHCGQDGYEPISEANGQAWKDAWIVVGYCDGTIAPTTAPSYDPANVGGCPVPWAAGNIDTYEVDDLVSVVVQTSPEVKLIYKCKKWPFSFYCGQYSPIDDGGDQGWDVVGKCDGTIAPTASPSFGSIAIYSGGCPEAYDEANELSYEAGDSVSYVTGGGTLVYECKPYPYDGYCKQTDFAPGTKNGRSAWELKGLCEGTMAPTGSPIAYANDPLDSIPIECEAETAAGGSVDTCYYTKAVTTQESCTCEDADCPNPLGLSGAACTKDVTVTHCPTVELFSPSATYGAGEVVRVGTKRFKCKDWPFYQHCGVPYYAPTGEDYGAAWRDDGDCP